MSALQLLHIPRHTIRIAAYVLAAILGIGTLLFFALTRTQVGRDGLRRQIEQEFADTFEGHLQIGHLTGNLVQDLFASDIRLFDPEGHLVLRVDSLIARPNWSTLLRKRFSVGSLTLIRPTGYLLYQADSTWNLDDVFHRQTPKRAAPSSAWSFDSADLYLHDGTVHTRYEQSLPASVASGWLFNYAETQITDVQARATVEWTPEAKLIDVLRFSAALHDLPFGIDEAQGQFLFEPGRVIVNQAVLNAGRTSIRLSGAVDHLDSLRAGIPAAVTLDGELDESHFDYEALRLLMPRLPLADAVTLSARVAGPLSRLAVEDVTLQRGQSRLRAEGTIRSLADSLSLAMTLRNGVIASEDLHAVLPEAALPDFDHLGPITMAGTVEGSIRGRGVQGRRLRAAARLDVRGAPGHLNGTVTARHRPGRALQYAIDVRADSLDVGRLLDDTRLASALHGRVTARGHGLSLDSLNTTIDLDLHHTRFAGHRLDTLHVEARLRGRRLETAAFARQAQQRLTARGELLWEAAPSYRLDLTMQRLDLGPLLAIDSLRSSFNATWALVGSGGSWEDLQGELTVQVAPSRMQWGRTIRDVPAHRSRLTVHPPSGPAPRLHLTGDALSLRLDGNPAVAPTRALGALWRHVLSEAWDQQVTKTYARRAPDPGPPALQAGTLSLDEILLQRDARETLTTAGFEAVTLDAALAVEHAEVLTALLPMLPPLATDLTAHLRVVADADRLLLSGTVAGDSLRMKTLGVDTLHTDFEASIALGEPVEQSLRVRLDARAGHVALGRQVFRTPRVSASLRDRSGTLSLATEHNDGVDAARLAAGIDLFADRSRVTLQDLHFAIGDYVWHHPEDEAIDLFADAVVIPGLLFESAPADSAAAQRVRLYGALSSAARDTFFVEVEEIGLPQLSHFFSLKPSLGGRLNGRLALTGSVQREVTGALRVDSLVLDDRLVGHLDASSRYLPGTPDVALDVALHPIAVDDTMRAAPSSGLRKTENALRLAGTFRLPRGGDDPGVLDLSLNVQRADAFFFEYIISEVDRVEGAFAGQGTLRGTFAYPLFDANLTLTDGRFEIPMFNLHYRIDGPVRVDDEAIRIDEVVLRDPTGGEAQITGSLFFNEYRFFSFDLAAHLETLQIIDVPNFSRELPFYGTIWASGDATLTGPLYQAFLRSSNVTTSEQSEIFIPITESETVVDPGFIIFADSTGRLPETPFRPRRANILARRPVGERAFTEGMEMDLNIFAPEGSTVHLVIDPLLGDVINAVGSGRIQLQRREDEFSTFGTLEVDSGDYLFTAGEVFVRRFLINEGSITWTGDPLNPTLDIEASYQTRASRTGLPEDIAGRLQSSIPLIVHLHITGELNAVLVGLNLAIDRSRQEAISNTQIVETYLNQPDRAAQYATSVLLTNSFLLTTDAPTNDVLAGSAFNSVSALVSSQINRYLSQAIPNTDFTFGVQSDETANDLDVSAGVAIRLLNERLVIRGQGIYRGLGQDVQDTAQQSLQGEFVVEIRLSPSVSVEVFYRREGDVLSDNLVTSETGAGLSYQTQFPTWRKLLQRLFGGEDKQAAVPDSTDTVVDAGDQ